MMVIDSSYTTFHCIFCILWTKTKDTETFYGNNNNNNTSHILAVPVQGLVTTQGHLHLYLKVSKLNFLQKDLFSALSIK